ncbi:MAG: hypothetical protein R6V10_13965 [bacterium]
MDLISREELKRLMEERDDPCISIYSTQETKGPKTRENHIRFKNMLREAESRLASYGYKLHRLEDVLRPARHLLENDLFWQYQAGGLAVFISPGRFTTYRVPMAFHDTAVVNDRFHIKHLLPLFTSNGVFYVLCPGKKQVRLLQCTRFNCKQMDPAQMPRNMEEALGEEIKPGLLEFHTKAVRASSGRRAPHPGHGEDPDDGNDKIHRYFKEIDKGVKNTLQDRQAPLVVCLNEEETDLYKKANTYPNLVKETINKNPEVITDQELKDRAWEIVEPAFNADRQREENRYHELNGTGQTAASTEDIVKAAFEARIRTLFVDHTAQVWGDYQPDTLEIEVHENRMPGDSDLIDLAAVYTLTNGGAVYAEKTEKMPENSPAGAILRY